MIDLKKRHTAFSKRVTSMKVIYDNLTDKNKELFLKSLQNNSFKIFFKSDIDDIIKNITVYKHNINYFHYTVLDNKKTTVIILAVKDLNQIRKNLDKLFNLQIKNKEAIIYGITN